MCADCSCDPDDALRLVPVVLTNGVGREERRHLRHFSREGHRQGRDFLMLGHQRMLGDVHAELAKQKETNMRTLRLRLLPGKGRRAFQRDDDHIVGRARLDPAP